MMFISLCIRMVCIVLRIHDYIPAGFIFAFPSVVQILTTVLPFTDTSNPLLTVRVAESLLGRLNTYKLAVVVPAHFLGCVVGAIAFRTVLPFVPITVVQPLFMPSETGLISSALIEISVISLYVCFYLIVPDLLEVNKHSRFLVATLILPLLIIGQGI